MNSIFQLEPWRRSNIWAVNGVLIGNSCVCRHPQFELMTPTKLREWLLLKENGDITTSCYRTVMYLSSSLQFFKITQVLQPRVLLLCDYRHFLSHIKERRKKEVNCRLTICRKIVVRSSLCWVDGFGNWSFYQILEIGLLCFPFTVLLIGID